MALYEPDLPVVHLRKNGKLIRYRDYTALYDKHEPNTLIRVAAKLGSWTYELGTSQGETELLRESALTVYSQNKAMYNARQDALKHARTKLKEDMKKVVSQYEARPLKRNRPEVVEEESSESSDEESYQGFDDEEYNEVNNNYHYEVNTTEEIGDDEEDPKEKRINELIGLLRLLCGKYGEYCPV
jgi:hypothetical protein